MSTTSLSVHSFALHEKRSIYFKSNSNDFLNGTLNFTLFC